MKLMHLGKGQLNQLSSDRIFVGAAIVIATLLAQLTLSLMQTDPIANPVPLLLGVDIICYLGVILIADGYIRKQGKASILMSLGSIITGVLGILLYVATQPVFLDFVWPHTIALHFYLSNSLWIGSFGLLIQVLQRHRAKESKQ
jgi:hypothetical protein